MAGPLKKTNVNILFDPYHFMGCYFCRYLTLVTPLEITIYHQMLPFTIRQLNMAFSLSLNLNTLSCSGGNIALRVGIAGNMNNNRLQRLCPNIMYNNHNPAP